MKKLLAIALVAVMMMSLSVTAFAAETTVTTDPGEATINVNAIYSSAATTPDVISVDVEWGAMEFTYSVGGTKDWDATKHEYVNNTTAAWTASGNTVTVTNHSNVAVRAELSFAAETAYNTVTGGFDKATMNLSSGEDVTYANAAKDTATLTLDGTLDESVTALTKVGTIIVKISKAA